MGFKDWKSLISKEELEAQFAQAKAASLEADAVEPRAKSVSFDQCSGLIVIALKNGAFFSFPPDLVQGLRGASAEDLSDIWLDTPGSSVHWDRLDADFSIAGLVAGLFGTKAWMAELGRKGGQVKSQAKAESARINGKKGGRPKKAVSNSL
jgi:Protein of unknown function (DUF2442)